MNKPAELPGKISPAQWGVIGMAVAFSAGAVLYKLLMHIQLGHSAAMFIGIPALLAILLALTPKAHTATGAILKGITFALLLVAPLLGEGYVCILFASPLFYLVGVITGVVIDYFRRKGQATLTCLAVLLLPMCFEGVTPSLTFDRAQSVEVSRVVNAPMHDVQQALSVSPRVQTLLPSFLSVGFPRPLDASGTGLSVGDTRIIHFSGAEGDPPGDLTLRIAERRPGYVRFETVSDGSKLTQWLRWTSSEVEFKAQGAASTNVTWRINFQRELDPAWYFTPWERFAVHAAASYLINANAAPERSN